jgi:hypothetical protein
MEINGPIGHLAELQSIKTKRHKLREVCSGFSEKFYAITAAVKKCETS